MNCWVFSPNIIDTGLKKWNPGESIEKNKVFQNKVQDLLFEVFFKHGKVGIARVFQPPLSTFRVICGLYKYFSTPAMKLWVSKRGSRKFLNILYEIFEVWQNLFKEKKSFNMGFVQNIGCYNTEAIAHTRCNQTTRKKNQYSVDS